MKPERWREVERIFLAALDAPSEEREALVRRECGADEELCTEVLRMVRLGGPEPTFLAPPSPEAPGPFPPDVPEHTLGDFDLLQELGRGGMGVVFKAWQRSLGRPVALKVLPPSVTLTSRQVERFLREARAVAKLSHPGIAAVLTVGEEKNTYYFAMELVEGHDLSVELLRLRDALAKKATAPSQLPSTEAHDYFRAVARIARDAADALAYAHDHGIVHRDVKPSNLLLDASGHVKLVDFGLARDEAQGTITRTGDLAGTPHYMSPEQARAKIHQVDHRTDVYSLGVVLYELLTLKRPFEGKTSQEILTQILHADPPRVRRVNPRVPRDLETICLTAMAKELPHRYPSAGALRDDLERFLEHQAIHAKPPAWGELVLRFAQRRRRPLAAAVIALVGLGLGFRFAWMRARTQRIEERVALIRAARAEAPLDSLPLSRVCELLATRTELVRLGYEPSAPEDPVAGLDRDLAAFRGRTRQAAEDDLAYARDAVNPEGAREFRKLSALQKLVQLALVFPDDPELQQAARVESALPTLSVEALDVDGKPAPASVYVREIDFATSLPKEKRFLGRAPIVRAPLAPGYLRVVVEFDAGGFRELPCSVQLVTMETTLRARRRTNEAEVTAGMVLFEGGAYTVGDFGGELTARGRTVQLEAFYLDPTEVSNAEYARFVETTGHPAPPDWRFAASQDDFLRDHGDRPVIDVTWEDAVAYAVWLGKRLPTSTEWHRAAGGVEGRALPYVPDRADEPMRGNVRAPERFAPTQLGNWDLYLRYAVPVTSFPEARTPEGLYHMYGNVEEWTESLPVELYDDGRVAVPRHSDRVFLGGAWNAGPEGHAMHALAFTGFSARNAYSSLGFRCAKSASP